VEREDAKWGEDQGLGGGLVMRKATEKKKGFHKEDHGVIELTNKREEREKVTISRKKNT